MNRNRGATIINVPVHSGRTTSVSPGIKCCFCQCCTCIQLGFLKTGTGMIKLAEIILGFFCQSLALNFGMQYANTMGPSFQSFITSVYWSLMTSALLLVCYVFSSKSVSLIRSSAFETLFNSLSAFSYLTTCSYLGYTVNTILQPTYLITPYYQVYPAMSAAYMLGTCLGLLYAYDAYKSYRYFRGYRY